MIGRSRSSTPYCLANANPRSIGIHVPASRQRGARGGRRCRVICRDRTTGTPTLHRHAGCSSHRPTNASWLIATRQHSTALIRKAEVTRRNPAGQPAKPQDRRATLTLILSIAPLNLLVFPLLHLPLEHPCPLRLVEPCDFEDLRRVEVCIRPATHDRDIPAYHLEHGPAGDQHGRGG
jgi:hypothetical protein